MEHIRRLLEVERVRWKMTQRYFTGGKVEANENAARRPAPCGCATRAKPQAAIVDNET